MTDEALQHARREASEAAARLRLPLRSKVWKGQAGEFVGAGVGSSLDFQDHRTYVPGDDPRHINWQAYARTGSYTMKLYREEVRPVIDLVFDVSESMFFAPEKARRSLGLFYFTVESARRAGADTRITMVCGPELRPVPVEAFDSDAWQQERRSMATANPAAVPDLSRIPFRPSAIRVLVSDLLFEADPTPLMRLLSGRHGSPVLLCPFAAAEADPGWDGSYEFIDAESQGRHPHRIDPMVLKRYRENYAAHFALWKETAQRHHSVLARVDSEGSLQQALFADAVAAGALELTH